MRNSDPPCAILADDLTGAADAGLPFAARGYPTNIWLGEHHTIDSAAVHIYDTASRHDSPEEAATKVRRLCNSLKASNCPLIFKKLDSTLLGNLAVEIEAAMESLGFDVALVAPAFPAMGRTLIEGELHLFGEPSDPPRFLPALLREQGASNVAHIGLDMLKHDRGALARALSQLASEGARLIVLDSASHEDLRKIVQEAELLEVKPLLAGSGALAGEIARTRYAAGPGETPVHEKTAEAGRILLVIGSANAVTERQINHLLHLRPVVTVKPGTMVDGRALTGDSHFLLRITPGGIAENYVRIISTLFDSGLRGLVLSGGDTAEAVARGLNASGIRLGGEIVPGVPWGCFIGGAANGLRIATKSGGFGADDALVNAVDFLQFSK